MELHGWSSERRHHKVVELDGKSLHVLADKERVRVRRVQQPGVHGQPQQEVSDRRLQVDLPRDWRLLRLREWDWLLHEHDPHWDSRHLTWISRRRIIQGRPFHRADINECLIPNATVFPGKCVNRPGFYDCAGNNSNYVAMIGQCFSLDHLAK
ncbi:hypothetical protein NL676_017215 [Syzygium grande]|nr:hypothetical protein NL676_017215 [Syzygium grande]